MQANKLVLIIDQDTLQHVANGVRADGLPNFWAAIDNAVAVDELVTVLKVANNAAEPLCGSEAGAVVAFETALERLNGDTKMTNWIHRPWWWIDQGGLDEAEEATPGLLAAWADQLIATGDDNKRRAAAHLMDVLDDMERIRKEDEVQP